MTDTNNTYVDDEIDEDFSSQPAEQSIVPENELSEINNLLKDKSHKELLNYVSELMIINAEKLDEIQKLQLHTGVDKSYGGFSKRQLIELINKSVNEKNKHVFKENVVQNSEKQLTRDELKKKLRERIGSRQNPMKQLQKIQEQLQNYELEDEDEAGTTKKNKKLNPKKLKNKIMNQMSNLMKNNFSPSNDTPNSV